jgi:hypothetical protein
MHVPENLKNFVKIFGNKTMPRWSLEYNNEAKTTTNTYGRATFEDKLE